MKKNLYIIWFLFGFITVYGLLFSSCRKDIIYSNGNLEFSLDTLLFDTVFTTIGSTTKRFKVYNRSNRSILIEEIQLMGGSNSTFRMNVNGEPGVALENIELEGNDSIFIFIEVTLEVNNQTNPLIIMDSIRFQTNGKNQYTYLAVWGQDAYFHVNEIVQGTWNNDKPHVIYGLAAVGFPGIDSNLTLNIPAGTQIYLHNQSNLWVYKSTLNIQGQLGNEVTFQGDRLELFYDDKPGQWGRIILFEAQTSTIDYAIIKNGTIGIQVEKSGDNGNNLILTNTRIENMNLFSLLINEGGEAIIDNAVILNAGVCTGYIRGGGSFDIRNSIFANYWSGSRSDPGFVIQNWYENNEGTFVNPINGSIHNTVIWGNRLNEFIVDTIDHPNINLFFNHCAIRNEDTSSNSQFNAVIWNEDPNFTDPFEGEFTYQLPSPLQGNGDAAFSNLMDILGKPRSTPPSIGAYELE